MKRSQCDTLLSMLKRWRVSARDLYVACGSLACHSRVAELSERGYDIQAERYKERGAIVTRYRLVK